MSSLYKNWCWVDCAIVMMDKQTKGITFLFKLTNPVPSPVILYCFHDNTSTLKNSLLCIMISLLWHYYNTFISYYQDEWTKLLMMMMTHIKKTIKLDSQMALYENERNQTIINQKCRLSNKNGNLFIQTEFTIISKG